MFPQGVEGDGGGSRSLTMVSTLSGARRGLEGCAMTMYVIKRRDSELYVAAEGGFYHELGVARFFSSREAADAYRLRRVIPNGEFVVCEVSDNGRVLPCD
jgi:hypothetical protein